MFDVTRIQALTDSFARLGAASSAAADSIGDFDFVWRWRRRVRQASISASIDDFAGRWSRRLNHAVWMADHG